MLKLIKLSIILLLIFNIFSTGVLTVGATSLINDENSNAFLNNKTDCLINGNCQLNDFMLIVLSLSNIILELVGSLSLLAFIVGGLMWLLSGGKAELVERGKQTIIGATIGLAIVFTSFMIIQMVYASLGLDWKGKSNFPTPIAAPDVLDPAGELKL